MDKIKRFASHRLYIPHEDLLLSNQVVEIEEGSGEVLSYYSLKEEISFTEWLGGLIVVSCVPPSISQDYVDDSLEIYVDEGKKIRSASSVESGNTPLKAYHITNFNVSSMCFSVNSRVTPLY